jgi:hypothetical protein
VCIPILGKQVLVQNKLLIMPAVYIKPEVDKNLAAKVKEIVKRRQGSIVGESALFHLLELCLWVFAIAVEF